MLKMKRDEVNAIKGVKPATPAPAAAPVERAGPDLAALTSAISTMSNAVADAARMAAQAQADVAAMLAGKSSHMEANIVRDQEGRMTKVIITSGKQ